MLRLVELCQDQMYQAKVSERNRSKKNLRDAKQVNAQPRQAKLLPPTRGTNPKASNATSSVVTPIIVAVYRRQVSRLPPSDAEQTDVC